MKQQYLTPNVEITRVSFEQNFLGSLDLTKEIVTWNWDDEDVE